MSEPNLLFQKHMSASVSISNGVGLSLFIMKHYLSISLFVDYFRTYFNLANEIYTIF